MSKVAQLVGGESLTQVSLISRSMFSTTAPRHPDICRDPCHSPLFPKKKKRTISPCISLADQDSVLGQFTQEHV